MTIAQHIVDVTKRAAEEFFRYAEAVPEDKLDWIPLEGGQSVIGLCREIAVTPDWGMSAMTDRQHTKEDFEAMRKEMDSWLTVARCRDEFDKRIPAWVEFLLAFPPERYEEAKWLPFNGGRDHAYLELFEFPRWNITYHLGQVAYIQRLYGDMAMH